MKPSCTLSLILTSLVWASFPNAQAQPAAASSATRTPDSAMSASLLASEARPAADRARDALRKPQDLLALAPLQKGAVAADLMPGGGYFTRLLSLETGPSGQVFAVVPAEMVARHPQIAQKAKAIGGSRISAMSRSS